MSDNERSDAAEEDAENVAEAAAQVDDASLKPKVWRAKVVQEFVDNITIRTCLEIVEGGETLKSHEILFQVFERFHARVENQSAFRRPDELLHPHKLLEVTAFKTMKEWDTWKASSKPGMGKASVTNPDAGALSEAYLDWASKKWEKYKLLKREIHDSVQRLWLDLVPNNILPSGANRVNEIVEKLRKGMFDVWKFAKTHGKSKIRYANQEMTGPCADWHPNWWNVWKAMGPASGRCSATFMSEVGMKISTIPAALPDAFVNHYGAIAAGGAANFSLQPRKAIKEDAKNADSSTPVTPVTQQSQSRASLDAKASLLVRKQEIQRLEFLVKSEHSTSSEKTEYARELFMFMKRPVVFDSSDPTSSSSAGKSFEAVTFVDGASISVKPPFCAVEPQKLLPLLLQMPTASALNSMTQRSDTPADYVCVEEDAMRGDQFTLPSCPVNIAAADFANDCFLLPSQVAALQPAVSSPGIPVQPYDNPLPSQVAALQAAVSSPGIPVQPYDSPLPSQVAALQAAVSLPGIPVQPLPSPVAALHQAAVIRQRLVHQKKFVSLISTRFRQIDTFRDGDCMFNSIVLFFNRSRLTLVENGDEDASGIPFSAKILRNLLADELIRLDGVVPGMLYNPFDTECADGDVLQRGGDPRNFTVESYADALRTTLYGGDIEIALTVWLFKLKIFVFSALQWNGRQTFLTPAIHVHPECESPEGGKLCVLWTEGDVGGMDHWQLLIPKRESRDEFGISSSSDEGDGPGFMSTPPKCTTFPYLQTLGQPSHSEPFHFIPLVDLPLSKHAAMMGAGLPKWNIDLKVVTISPEVGRGIVSLRIFEEHDVVGTYDGHRCDVDGNIISERDSLRLFFEKHPALDRRVTGDKFKLSHAVSCGRNKDAGVVIDGHPLCHPMLDANIDSLGRFALANSASSGATGVADCCCLLLAVARCCLLLLAAACCFSLLLAAACCCLLLAACCCSLLLDAACCCLLLLAAARCCLLLLSAAYCLLLRAAACCCLLRAVACCLLPPAAACCCLLLLLHDAAACCCVLLRAAACCLLLLDACCLLLPAAACCCLLLAAACCCVLLLAACCFPLLLAVACCLLLPAAACCCVLLLAACCCLLLLAATIMLSHTSS
jgi:hypothetical protein